AFAHQVVRDSWPHGQAREPDNYHTMSGVVSVANAVYFASATRRSPSPFDTIRYATSRLGDPRNLSAAQESIEREEQAGLLCHIIGDPFHPVALPSSWPATVLQLAESVYQGQPAHFALVDALLEASQPELAEHFRSPVHPKGCWVLDRILGKKSRRDRRTQ